MKYVKTIKIFLVKKLRYSLGLGLVLMGTCLLYNFTSPESGDHDKKYWKENHTAFPNRSYVVPVKIPQKLTFLGEEVPLDYYDVKEALDRELLVNSYWQSQTLILLKKQDRYFSIIEPILKEEGVPDDFKYLAVAESGLNPRIVSPAGATGMWQIMRGTGRELGLEISDEIDERYHIEKATYAFCKYIKKAHDKFQDWVLAAASYNAGRAGVLRQISRQDCHNYFELLLNTETGRYVYRIMAFKIIFEHPKEYGFVLPPSDKYPILKTETIKVQVPIEDFTKFAHSKGISYKVLKDFNPWLRQTYLKSGKKTEYELKIPTEDFRKSDL